MCAMHKNYVSMNTGNNVNTNIILRMPCSATLPTFHLGGYTSLTTRVCLIEKVHGNEVKANPLFILV